MYAIRSYYVSLLSRGLVNRELLTIELDNHPFDPERVASLRSKVASHLSISMEEAGYLVLSDSISNYAYSDMDDRISILDKRGISRDIAEASDMLNIAVLSKTVRNNFV